jgi:hypothetical protein
VGDGGELGRSQRMNAEISRRYSHIINKIKTDIRI